MRKKIVFLIILIVLTILGIKAILNNKDKTYEIIDTNHGQFAFFYEEETGSYKKSTDSKWSTGDYVLNISESICDGEKNPSFLSWNYDNKSVTLKRNKSTKCTLYFDKVIKIEYIEDLVDLSLKVNSGNTYSGKTIVLTRDLDFQNSHEDDYKNKDNKEYNDFNNDNITGKTIYEELTDTSGFGFLPIGNNNYAFEGTFDGNNHTISNLYINNVNNVKNLRLGLFGVIKNSKVSNLTVTGTIKNGTSASNAGLISDATAHVKLTNIINKINITSENYSWTVGGVIATVNSDGDLTIENCINYGTITGGQFTGGIMGGIASNAKVTIKNSINYGVVKNSNGSRIGGLLGLVNTNSEIILNYCKNYGKIEVSKTANTDTIVGGLIGEIRIGGSSFIDNSSNEILNNIDDANGIIVNNNGIASVYVGGLLGLANGNVNVTNCYNNAPIEASTPNAIYTGGIVGRANSKIQLTNCYNLANISSKNTENALNYIGGLVGHLSYNDSSVSTIEKCYNKGNIEGGNRIGGVVGIASGKLTIIINKSYNTGNITGQGDAAYTLGVYAGGLFGQSWDGPKIFILNSYNIGSITAKVTNNSGHAAGMVAETNNNTNISNVIVLNSYNMGKLEAQNVANGIGTVLGANNYKVNNFYNIGDLIDAQAKNSIINITTSGTVDTKNAYYLKQENVLPTNGSNTDGMYEITNDIKNNFVNILNDNKNKINLSEYGEEIKDYELANWIQGIDGYPILEGVGDLYYSLGNTKYVRDLSGNGVNGKIYGAKIQNDGLQTGDANNWYGYVDCGLARYDFKNSMTLVIRTKINKVESSGRSFLGNTEGGGGEIGFDDGKIDFLLRTTGSTQERVYSKEEIIQDKWYTIVGTFDGIDKKLYVDGDLNETYNKEGTINLSPLPFLIGAVPDADANNSYTAKYTSNITVSDALIYDRALSEEEINNNFSQEINNINKDKLLLWYKFA